MAELQFFHLITLWVPLQPVRFWRARRKAFVLEKSEATRYASRDLALAAMNEPKRQARALKGRAMVDFLSVE